MKTRLSVPISSLQQLPWFIIISIVLSLLLFSSTTVVVSLAPPHPDFDTWESVHQYRRRLNMTYTYTPKHLHPEQCRFLSEEQCEVEDGVIEHAIHGTHGRHLAPTTGTVRVLVLLVRFADHTNRELPLRDFFEKIFNGDGISEINPVGSIKEYYRYASVGQYRVSFDVRDWHTSEFTEAQVAQNSYGLVGQDQLQKFFYSAMDAVDSSGIDWFDGYIDEWGMINGVVVIHSGVAAEYGDLPCLPTSINRIWSQGTPATPNGWTNMDYYQVNSFSVTSALERPVCNGNVIDSLPRMGMALATHETLHQFGLIDLYDQDADETRLPIGGTGRFCIMSNAKGWTSNASIPGHMSPFSRLKVKGWLEPIEITQDGYYAIQSSEISSHIYKISHNFPEGEYLLIENRQPIKWDSNWPTGGIVIYHIDETMPKQTKRGYPGHPNWPADHYQVAVVQADGNYDLEKGVNFGDEGDFWVKDDVLGPGPNFPNTDSIQSGVQKPTGISITIKADPGFIMTFHVSGIDSTNSRMKNRNGANPVSDPDTTGTVLQWLLTMLGGIGAMLGVMLLVL